MKLFAPGAAALFAVLLLTACSSQPVDPGTCDPACGTGTQCKNGHCVALAGEDAGPDVIIPPDAGRDTHQADPFDPDNAVKDSDCDGLSDQEEFSTVYPGGPCQSSNDCANIYFCDSGSCLKKSGGAAKGSCTTTDDCHPIYRCVTGTCQGRSDPDNPDSDEDGILDGVEMGHTKSPDPKCTSFVGDADPATTTSPVNPDSDGDGLKDGEEDVNRNGKVDPGESDPRNPDTDNDGLNDHLEVTTHTNPVDRDTDHDGIPDGVEDVNHNGLVDTGETDPRKADSDGDGCLDGQEDKNWNHLKDPGETDPLNPSDCGPALGKDSDCDGLSDAEELKIGTNPNNPDTDGDGLLDGMEVGVITNPDTTNCHSFKADADPATRTDPLRPDSDCDGLKDGDEDKNHDGKVDPGETDPNKRDSDGDGLTDGVESGVCVNPDTSHCPNFVADADCGTTKTDPTNPDSDGDGIPDGAEDTNQNGKWDPGELNPLDGSDGVGPAQQACAVGNLRQISLAESAAADLTVALTPDYTEVARAKVAGVERALMVYNPSLQTIGIAMLLSPSGASASADETAGANKLRQLGTVSNAVAQTFTTWDKYPAAHDQLDLANTSDLKAAANSIAQAFLPGATGLLSGNAGVGGPFKVESEYVHRSAQHTVAVISLVPTSRYNASKPFVISDLGGGSALAQFGDTNAAQCEVFQTASVQKVDFLWVVDNSGSMAESQNAVAAAGQSMINQLSNSTLDWRIAGTTASYYGSTTGADRYRPFTTDLNVIRSWFTLNGSDWFGTNGSGIEQLLYSAELTIKNEMLPASAGNVAKIRPGATLVVIVLGDSEDQSSYDAAHFLSFFSNYDGLNSKAQVHAIECPLGPACSTQEDPVTGKIVNVVAGLNGVFGDIRAANNGGSLDPTITAILNAAIAGVSPYTTKKPPIASTIKVALDPASLAAGSPCTASDLPRDRTNGFDFDGLTGRILFFGNCRPTVPGKKAAVSYRYWTDLTPNPDGNPDPCGQCTPPFVCDRNQNKCVCPADCGAQRPGAAYYCDYNVCAWVCAPDCNGCGTNWQCDTSPGSCQCKCSPSVTCAPGFRFDTASCLCVCDPPALHCGSQFNADANLCACICKTDCGGTCAAGLKCDQSACACRQPPQ